MSHICTSVHAICTHARVTSGTHASDTKRALRTSSRWPRYPAAIPCNACRGIQA